MKIGVYPGTFDPITFGHLDIIVRAGKLFDKVIIAVAEDNTKNPIFNIEERRQFIENSISELKNVEVSSFSGLLVNYASKKNALSIIRGLRVLSDFEDEFKMALMNRSLNDEIVTIFLMPHEKYTHLSSSIIREVARLKGDVSTLVPKIVREALETKFNK
ncbi:MAG: pantetheine-phosphate adenylyltransferase [Candidatus Marinimicrobia bacterium]|nr:pantetheine-phosphate adenylyltransferase [Candidatus Neomarinimicrobiota bacterium]|tara:strand:+ start:156 stop:635 length:480 start_codon:yes stop_codon:yes gene_type:complete